MNTTTYKKKDEETVKPEITTYSMYTPGFGFKKPDADVQQDTKNVNPVTTEKKTIPDVVPNSDIVDYSMGQQAAAKSFSYNGTKPTYASPYSAQIDRLFNEIQNAPEFSYDPNTDEQYNALKGLYTNLGQQAMKDTSAQIAAQTGGIASSYASSAGAQAYNQYMNQLAGFVPELQQLAYEMYQNDLNQKYQQLDALNVMEDNAYGKYRDKLGDYYTDYNNAYNQFLNEQEQQNYLNEFAYQQYLNDLEQQNYLNELAYQQQQDALNQQNYQNELAYQQYLDSQKQQNYLNEFEYQKYLNEQEQQNYENEVNYQQSLNALEQQNYEREFTYKQEQDDLDRIWNEALTKYELGDFSGLNALGIDTSNLNTAEEDTFDPYSDEIIGTLASSYMYNDKYDNGHVRSLVPFEEAVENARFALAKQEIDTNQFNLIVENLYTTYQNRKKTDY